VSRLLNILGPAGLGFLLSPVLAAAAPPRAVTDDDVDRAIAQVRRYLWSRQRADGTWPHDYRAGPAGGTTAIAVFALLDSGERASTARMKKGLEALCAIKTTNLYVVATRVMALSLAGAGRRDCPYRPRLEADMKYLTRQATRCGAWGYSGPERTGDNSCSQFALLALWEADRAGVPLPAPLIRLVERTWLRRQRRDGGWTYPAQPGVDSASTLTMTTAGLASLFICQDVLAHACKPYPHRRARQAAWDWLEDHLREDYIRNGYLAFCVQRVGMSSGRKFIGQMDWFAVGAARLAEPNPRGRSFSGRWGPVVRAAFELIFLSRGRIPLTFNKLTYGRGGDRDLHSRDIAHFTEYMRRTFERRMRWQIVRITDDVQLMLDAPILLVEGTGPLGLSPAQWAKLREYTLRGGTLLLVPIHGSRRFLTSAREALAGLYEPARRDLLAGSAPATRPAGAPTPPERLYTLQPLPADHPLYNAFHKLPNGPVAAPMWGVSDGTRLLAVLCGRDITCSWQKRARTLGRIDYALGVNFFMYATGANSLRTRMRPVFTTAGREVRHRAKVAWLRHGGNWNTQPYALDYLSRKLTAENRVAIDLTRGSPINAAALKGQHLAWMTGSREFVLSDRQVQALRAYLRGGGVLFVNAVGGSRAFDAAARAMLERLFAGLDVAVVPAGPDSPLMTGRCGPFRLYLLAGRPAVIYCPLGVHDTLDGHTAHAARSYMPPAARDIAANVVLYALARARGPHRTTRRRGRD